MKNWKKYGFEFLSIFIAVITAFALNNWNDSRNAKKSEDKILLEIANGLEKDLEDINQNIAGHKSGMNACIYFRNLIAQKEVSLDSMFYYYSNLTRDYISIQNTAGYETMKSRGLEVVQNDSLRLKIISLYEYDFDVLRKLEEEYAEMQYHNQYFKEINTTFAPMFKFNADKMIVGFNLPINIPEAEEKITLLYLMKIQSNRMFIMQHYKDIETKVNQIRNDIKEEIKD